MDIELFCPSRGRPDAARELRASFDATKAGSSVRLTFLLDRDDESQHWYPQEALVVGTPTGDPTGPLNREATRSKADAVGFIGDDSRFETPGWDLRVAAALQQPGFVWGLDGHEIPWPSTVFVSREIVRSLGWLSLPSLRRGFFDVVWMHLSGAVRDSLTGWRFPPGNCARILEDVMFRHDNSNGHVDPEVIAQDERIYKEWVRSGLKADRRRVFEVTELAHFFS